MNREWTIRAGRADPLGACVRDGGVNFVLFSAQAEKIELCLFVADQETRLCLPARSGHLWHGFVPGATAGLRYGYRIHGGAGARYCNPQKLLIDPYTRALDGSPGYGSAEERAWFDPGDSRDNAARAAKSVVSGNHACDWGDDSHPDVAWAQTVIYEVHVKGFTRLFPDLKHAGSYRALADPRVIAHLTRLGVTAVELLPIQQHFDEAELQRRGMVNYWGYNTVAHFAVEPRYAADSAQAAAEFSAAVKALHSAGIEVILDVVYNHTAEEDRKGPLLCQRGIDNAAWYLTDDAGDYLNHSGCGNTVQVAHRDITRWLLDSLRYWVENFHVDGFRFDLATVLGREPEFAPYGKFFQALYQDPVLRARKLIVEPWDLGDRGYQLGAFAQPLSEWNGRFRDDIRRFWVQQSGALGLFAERFAGSSDLFCHDGRAPAASLNFITAHDGFTLRDLVSYDHKHNEANGEQNQDGSEDNFSDNHGVEGKTRDPEILAARRDTQKALLATLLLANGTPMLLAGDEFGHSQQGNNNAYCQDNETTWLNWRDRDEELLSYCRALIACRKEFTESGGQGAWWGQNVRWFTCDAREMRAQDWSNRQTKALQILIDDHWLLLVNGKRGAQGFFLPEGAWRCRLAPREMQQQSLSPQDGVSQLIIPCMGLWVYRRASFREA